MFLYIDEVIRNRHGISIYVCGLIRHICIWGKLTMLSLWPNIDLTLL